MNDYQSMVIRTKTKMMISEFEDLIELLIITNEVLTKENEELKKKLEQTK